MIYLDFACVFILGCVVGRYINIFYERNTEATSHRPIQKEIIIPTEKYAPTSQTIKKKHKPTFVDDEKAYKIEQHERKGEIFFGE